MKKLAAILLMALCLTGCGRLQLEDRLLVISLGLDRLEDGQLEMTVQVPSASKGSGSEDKKAGGAGGYTLISVTGSDGREVAEALDAKSPHLLNFSHLRQVVFSYAVAESEDFEPLLKQIFRRHPVRSNAHVVVIEGGCKEFLKKQKPDIGEHLGKYLDTVMKNLIAKRYVPDATLALVVRDLSGSASDPPLIWGEVNQEGKIQFLGAALTSQGRVAGRLSGHEVQLLALLAGGGQGISIETQEGRSADVSTRRGAQATIRPDGSLAVSLHVTAYTPVEQSASQQEIEGALQEELRALITKLQAADSDAAGFGRQTLFGLKTLAEQEAVQWRFASAPLQVSVSAQMVISAS